MTVIDIKHSPILEAKEIWVAYKRGPDVLTGVSIQIFPGLTTMILGRSGSGKTTLLKTLAGLVKPHRGSIQKSPFDSSDDQPHIAYIPQSLGLVRHMTALENTLMGSLKDVPFVPSLLKIFPSNIVYQAKDLLVQLGLESKIDQKVGRLSGGQRQRVAIARALMQNPQVILADEFVSHLDALTTHEILGMTRELTKKNISFLIATHDVDLVKQYGDRVIIMGHGRVIFDSPTYCLTSEEMIKHFR